MSQVHFQTVNIALSPPNSSGTINGQGAATFDANVLSAGVAIQSFTVSYGDSDDHNLLTMGASITGVQWTGTTVRFSIALQLADDSDSPHLIDAGRSSMTVLVVANTE